MSSMSTKNKRGVWTADHTTHISKCWWECVLKHLVKDVALMFLFNIAQNKVRVSFVTLLLICHLEYFKSGRKMNGYTVCAPQLKKMLSLNLSCLLF